MKALSYEVTNRPESLGGLVVIHRHHGYAILVILAAFMAAVAGLLFVSADEVVFERIGFGSLDYSLILMGTLVGHESSLAHLGQPPGRNKLPENWKHRVSREDGWNDREDGNNDQGVEDSCAEELDEERRED